MGVRANLTSLKGRRFDTDTHKGKHHVNRKAEMETMLLDTKECQRLSGNHQKLDKRHGTDSP